MKKQSVITAAIVLTTALAAGPALAHIDPVEHGSLASGLSHPFTGLDHVLAMVTVGLWAALLGGRSLFVVPAAFVLAMLAGFGAAVAGLPLAFVEPAVLASIVVLGLVTAVALHVPTAAAAALVAVFAVFHGYAHGAEIGSASMLTYAAGFAAATIVLHAVGVAAGLVAAQQFARSGSMLVRVAGGAAALGGLLLALA